MAAPAFRGIVLALAVLVGLMAAAATPAWGNHAGPLAGQWHLDEIDAGGDATPDSSGHGLHATTSPQANLGPGRFGNAYQPVDFSRIRVLDNPVLETPAVTAIAWVRHSGSPGNAKYVIGKGDIPGCNGSSYALYSGVDGTGNLRFQVYDGTANRQSPAAGPLLWDGAWHMVAGTYDGTRLRLYVDGAEVGDGTPAPGAVAYGTNDDTLSIGSYPNDACGDTFFQGGIDEPRVYGRALSANEIARLAAHPGPDPPVLVPDAGPAPPPDGGAPPPPPPPPPPPADPPPPSAAFSSSLTSARLGQFVRFDATQSFGAAGIERFDWDLNGDGRPEARCDGSNPIMEAAFVRPSTGVTLTVTDARGRTASARVPLRVGGTRRSAAGGAEPAQRRPSRRLYQVAECHPAPGSPGRDITANGGPDGVCRQQVHYAGLIEAIGCWDRLESRAELPRSERSGLNAFLEQEVNSILRTTRESAARAARLPGSIFDAIDEEWVDRIYASRRPVRINGLDFVPRDGARIVLVAAARGVVHRGQTVVPSSSYIVSRNAKIMLGDVVLKSGPVRVRVDVPDAQLVNLRLPRSIPFLPAMPLTGSLDVTLIDRATRLGVNVMLPRYLGGVTARSTVTTTNAGGFGFDGLELHVGELMLGGWLTIRDVDFKVRNRRSGVSLSAEAEVFLPPGEAGDSIKGEFRIVDGAFDRLSLLYSAGAGRGIAVGPGVFLTRLGGSFQLDPTEVGGTVTVGFGQSVGDGCPPAGVTGTVLLHFAPGPVSFDARGEGSLFCLPFAQATAFLHVDGNGYVALGGGLNYDFAPAFSLDMNVNARFLFPHLTAEGAATACIFDKKLCGGVDALISDRGAAVCATLVEGFGTRIRGGLGFDWPPPAALINQFATAAFILDHLRLMATSCDVGPWRTVSAARAAQGRPRTFRVPRGQPGFALALTGAGEAPRVTLRGPGGREIVVPDTEVLRSGRDFAVRVPSEATTYLVVGEPAPGTWTIVEHEGSAPITGVRQAGILPPARVRGRVARGRGHTRVLRYSVDPIAGQVVTFVEEAPGGSRVLGRARGRRGSIRFTPSDARGTRRKIVALVEQSGLPRDNIDVAAYTARPPRVGRPRRLRVRRRGTRLIVTWRRPSNATHHLVRVNLSNGRRLLFQTGRRARVTVPGVGRRVHAGVSVAGRRGVLRPGPAARVSVRGRR